eukprot:141617-Chlamydomonas_euryale.AAC.1
MGRPSARARWVCCPAAVSTPRGGTAAARLRRAAPPRLSPPCGAPALSAASAVWASAAARLAAGRAPAAGLLSLTEISTWAPYQSWRLWEWS